MTGRREFLAGLAGVSVAVGAVVAAVASPDPDATLHDAIDAYRAAWAAREAAGETVRAAETKGFCACEIPHPGPWEEWREAHHPEGRFWTRAQDEPTHLKVSRVLDLENGNWPRKADGSLDLMHPAVVTAATVLLRSDEQAYYAPLKPIYDAQVAEYFERRAEAEEAAGLPELEDAADRACWRMDAARAALLAIRPQTAAGFVAKVSTLLTLADEPSEAIAEDEVKALIADTAGLMEGGAL